MTTRWTADLASLDVLLPRLEAVFEETALVVEHRFYRGSRAPHRLVVEAYDDLLAYVRANARPGDAFWFWRFDDLCRDDNAAANAKVADPRGGTPSRGAY